MKPTVLMVAIVAVAGTAGAQTVQAPAAGTGSAETPMNTQMGSGAAGAGRSPETASGPIPMSAAAATARKRIEMEGYTDVQGLAKGPDGLWQGTARRGTISVQVTVDHAGNVAAK
jgi:hypothetical protein